MAAAGPSWDDIASEFVSPASSPSSPWTTADSERELVDGSAELATMMARFAKAPNPYLQARIAEFVSRKSPLYRGELVGTTSDPATSVLGIAETVKSGKPYYSVEHLSLADKAKLLKFAARYGHLDLAQKLLATAEPSGVEIAIGYGHFDVATLMLEKHAVISNVRAVIDLAAASNSRSQFKQTIDFLLDHEVPADAIVNAVNADPSGHFDARAAGIYDRYFLELYQRFPAAYRALAAHWGVDPYDAKEALTMMPDGVFIALHDTAASRQRLVPVLETAAALGEADDVLPMFQSSTAKLRFLGSDRDIRPVLIPYVVRIYLPGFGVSIANPDIPFLLLEWGDVYAIMAHWNRFARKVEMWKKMTVSQFLRIEDIIGRDPTQGSLNAVLAMPPKTLSDPDVLNAIGEINFNFEHNRAFDIPKVQRSVVYLKANVRPAVFEEIWAKMLPGLRREFTSREIEAMKRATDSSF